MGKSLSFLSLVWGPVWDAVNTFPCSAGGHAGNGLNRFCWSKCLLVRKRWEWLSKKRI